jgi:hypothetical protein
LKDFEVRLTHLRESLGGSVGIDEAVVAHHDVGVGDTVARVQVTLRGIDVSAAKGADTY